MGMLIDEIDMELYSALLFAPGFNTVKFIATTADAMARCDPYEGYDQEVIMAEFPKDWKLGTDEEFHVYATKGLSKTRSHHFSRMKPEDIVQGVRHFLECQRVREKYRNRSWEEG